MAHFAEIARNSRPGVRLNEHLAPRRRCRVPTRLQDGTGGDRLEAPESRYRSGRSPDWLTFKTPAAPAVKPEAEED
jgi:hypothetical protein